MGATQRGSFVLASAILACWAARGAAVEFPYTAYTTSDDVYVRSGPGKSYYPTAKLKRGEKVEVYRHDPGGWYAIRPPRQSFSWVSARQLDLAEAGMGVVNTERAVARVGSLFSNIREVIQVRLDQGEKVELADSRLSSDGHWYKILPPAGEFRWVSKEYLDRAAPDGIASADDSSDDDEEYLDEDSEEESADDAPRRRGRKKKVTRGDIRLTSGGEEEEIDEDRSSRASSASARSSASKRNKAGQRGAASADEPKSFEARVADIDLDLSVMVAEEISTWSFDELFRRAQRAIDQAPTAIERGQARLVMNKVQRFADLKQRQDNLQAVTAETARLNRQLGRTDLVRFDDARGPRFDALGRLMPVQPRKDNDPPFVLMDSSGRIVSYVTPAPGINLRPYVDRQVGLNGQRGFVPELQTSHISVQHVTVLPGTTMRR